MTNRINVYSLEPEAYKALRSVEDYTRTSQLPALLREMIKIRSSQINGCAYCIDMHTQDAIKIGETPRRIFALSAWKNLLYFPKKKELFCN